MHTTSTDATDPPPRTGADPATGATGVDPLRFGRDARATAAVGFGIYAISILTGPILARGLGAAGRGDLAAVVSPAALIGFLVTFGIPTAAVYHAQQHPRRSIVMSSWVFSVVVGGLVVAVAWAWVPHFLADHDPDVTVPWFRAFLIANIASLPTTTAINLALAHGRTHAYNVLRGLPFVANAVALVLLVLTDNLTLTTALAAALGANLLQYVVTMAVTRSWPGRGFSRSISGVHLTFGSRVFVGSLAGFIVTRFDQFLLVGMVPSAELGIYAVAVSAAGVSGPVALALGNVLTPHVRQADDAAAGQAAAARAVRWAVASSTAIALLVAGLAPWVVPWFFGAEFRDAVHVLWLLLPGQVFTDTGNVFASKLTADGRPGLASQGVAAGAVITLLLIFPAVRLYSIEGAAAVTTASQLAFLLFVAVASRRVTRRRLAEDAARDGRGTATAVG